MPAATAAATPTVLSSTTMQRSRGASNCRAAKRKRSGAGLPRSTCEALKTCGSKSGSNRVTDPIEVAVRGDAARRRKGGEQLFNARYRGQLAGERDIDIGAECLEEPVRESAPEPGLDLGGQGDAVLAKTEHHPLSHRDRKIGGDQTLAENPAEYDLAVDQHPIAIEDDEIRQKNSLSGPVVAAYMAPYRDLSPLHGTH